MQECAGNGDRNSHSDLNHQNVRQRHRVVEIGTGTLATGELVQLSLNFGLPVDLRATGPSCAIE